MSGLLSSSRVFLVLLVLSIGVLVADDGDHTPHWSFVAPKRQTPALDVSAGVRSAIDLFVQARLETAGLQASPAADPRTLMRRLSLDLLGLLPAAERVDQFVEDPSPDAYERLVDEMLASQHFPERWGRHWLDLARYADSFGYERDDVRPNAWRYRDWVVRSINRNQPYDQFIIEQIAGDLLPDPTTEQLIATGLHRMNIKNNESGINKDDYQNRETVDRVKTTATSVLGLTFECAQCHDHKYDPISQAEFYQFYSFFNNVEAHDLEIEGTPEDQARYQAALEAYEAKSEILKTRKTVLEEMKQHPALEPWQASLGNNSAAIAEKLRWLDVSDALRASLGMPVAELGNEERQDVAEFWAMLGVLQDETRKQVSQLSVQKRHLPQPYVMTLREKSDARRATHVLIRGDFRQQGQEVGPRVPAVLNALESRRANADRLDLARWLVGPANPLAARVAVNHFWKHLFGSGLIATVDDFGTQGESPSHPALLDWLAVEFVESGWDRKHLIKTIVLSDTYRQSSRLRPELAEIDPKNRLLARQSRFRVESEVIRDLFLDAAGLIYHRIGGPTIHPPTPSGTEDLSFKYKTRWIVSDRPERYRRGMYIHFKRTNPYPSLTMFDSPESNVCEAERNISNTPLQALTTLNDPVFVECAQALGRDLAVSPGTPAARLQFAAARCLSRSFSDEEDSVLLSLFRAEQAAYRDDLATARRFVGDYSAKSISDDVTAAWIAVARAVLNLDEFVTRQ